MNQQEFSYYRIDDLKERLNGFPLGIMLLGHTGAGTLSTVNTLFKNEKNTIGYGEVFESKEIKPYQLNEHITIWNTPELDYSLEENTEYIQKIQSLLQLNHSNGNFVCGQAVDLVLVIINETERNIDKVLTFVKKYIMPEIDSSNILFAINRMDTRLKDLGGDQNVVIPDAALQACLDRQAEAIRQRIVESTGMSIKTPPVFSAESGFNRYAILDSIIDNDEWTLRKGSGIATVYSVELQNTTGYSESDESDDEEEDPVESVIGAILDGVADFFDDLF